MSEAWRVGVPFGLALFVLSLLATVPYFVTAIPDTTLIALSDGVSVLAFLLLIEAGRRAGRAAGAGFGALAGGIAGFLSSLAGLLQHALLSAAPGYARLVVDQYGHAVFAETVRASNGAGAMAGIFGAVLAGTILGVALGSVGGLVGAYVRPRRPRALGDRPA